ncbi:hypothetical protein J6500_16730 [Bradyrhizobium sp. WSM 1704]|uniref:hypothetical protein n=1 Tax=Bradyrhizobium semiaridum TaxID=2821404 RepID=UPI001CE30FAF|nr:hypothetical protein [Bradyrhizobium semiaridum]MCA6123528.1 hypothetical protein [Bradyrhizobium semiaridum]
MNGTGAPDRAKYLSSALVAYLAFVVAIALALPVLGLLEHDGIIGKIPWLSDYGRSLLPWASLLAAGFIIFQRSIRRTCAEVAAWLSPGDRNRWIIVGCCLLIFTSYCWQLHIGIIHRGVPGWVYADVPDVILPEAPAHLEMPADIDPALFKAALRPWVLPYVERSGYATNEVMFLHFKDGTMRPANYELAMVSWPKSTFGLVNGHMLHEAEFLAVIKHYFASRRAGRSMLLPSAIAYPRHLNYQPIDYTKYPPAGDIVGASIWTLTVHVDNQAKTVDVVGATEIAQVKG